MKLLALALLLLLPITGKTDLKFVRLYAIGLPSKGFLLQQDDWAVDKMGCLHFADGEYDERTYYIVCGSYTLITEP